MSDSNARAKYVRRDWSALFEKWRQSSQSQSAFCAVESIPVASFSAALTRSRKAAAMPAPFGFAKARLPTASSSEFVVELPRGVKVRIQNTDSVDFVRRLAREI